MFAPPLSQQYSFDRAGLPALPMDERSLSWIAFAVRIAPEKRKGR
ncbi:hypothetical protein [Massilia niastensis]|nr:hypothetical protein [Massilia niastensis]